MARCLYHNVLLSGSVPRFPSLRSLAPGLALFMGSYRFHYPNLQANMFITGPGVIKSLLLLPVKKSPPNRLGGADAYMTNQHHFIADDDGTQS